MKPLGRRRGQGTGRRGDWIGVFTAVVLLSMLLGSQFSLTPVTASQSPAAPGTVPLTQSVVLRLYHYRGYEMDSFSNTTEMLYGVSSNVEVSTALMNAAQYDAWQNNQSDPISNSITHSNGTDVQGSATVAPGQYFLVLYAYAGRALIQFGYQVNPSTPYSYGGVAPPLAMGVASFGIYNRSGIASSYQIQTNELVGLANISSVQVYTPDANRYGVSTTGFTVQLNAMLVVNDGGTSSRKVYWVQNVPDFETGPAALSFGDEIWNNTDASGFLSNQTITSANFQNGGFVYTTGATRFSSGLSFYSYALNNATYSVPLKFGLLMTAALVSGTGVLVQFGYRILANGSAVSSSVVWFDSVTIRDPAAQSAYFEISGSETPPTGLYYDAELVFAGEGNMESAYFTQLDATLALFYQNGGSRVLSSFPSYYGFSGDTGEAAANLVEVYSNGVVHLAPGSSPIYPYLGNASLSLDPSSFAVTGSPGTPAVTSASTERLTSTSSQSSTATQASSPSGEYVLVGVAVAVVVTVIVAVLFRLRPSSPPSYQEAGPPAGEGEPPPPSLQPAPAGAG